MGRVERSPREAAFWQRKVDPVGVWGLRFDHLKVFAFGGPGVVFGVWGLVFVVCGVVFVVCGLGCGVRGVGCRVWGLGCGV